MLKKRIPTIVGIFLLLLGITAGVYLVEIGPQSFTTRAEPEITPFDVRVTNVSERSFTVSWKTEASTIGLVKYGTNSTKLDLSALDSRETSGGEAERSYLAHYVTVSGLMPSNGYYFVIVSGTASAIYDDNGDPYQVSTTSSIEQTTSADTASGSIFFSDQSPAEDAIVYLSVSGGAPLSAVSSESGAWVVPISSSRTSDLENYLDYDSDSAVITIEVFGSDGSTSIAVTTTANDSPVEDIVLGETYDFTEEQLEDTLPAESQFGIDSFEESSPSAEESVTVENPKDGEAINTQTPEFIGEGPPGTTLEIILESEHAVTDSVTVENDGSWSWSPSSAVEPGEHTLTLSWLDENGITQIITRNFVVFAQGESDLPAFEATPSATGTPTPPDSQQATPTPSPLPTVTPIPTSIPTASPTAEPTPEATDPAIPVPGTGSLSLWLLMTGFGLSALGIISILRSRSSNKLF